MPIYAVTRRWGNSGTVSGHFSGVMYYQAWLDTNRRVIIGGKRLHGREREEAKQNVPRLFGRNYLRQLAGPSAT